MTEINDKIVKLVSLNESIKLLQADKLNLEDDILKHIKSDVDSYLKDKDYGSGTANVVIGDAKIKVTIGKKVTYDQYGLRKAFYVLKDKGQNPEEYISVKYDVSESKYKEWPSDLKDVFKAYRTVEPTKPKIEVEV